MSKKNDFKKEIYGNPNWINGRINRAEYIIRLILLGIVWECSLVGTFTLLAMKMSIPAILLGIFTLYVYWRIITTYVKRLHDLGWNGWFAVLLVVEELFGSVVKNEILSYIFIVMVFVLSLILLFKKGNKGANKYGKDPLTKYEENQ